MYNYPKAIKSFYMRANDDGKTVAAMDMLVPKVRTNNSAAFVTCSCPRCSQLISVCDTLVP